MSSLFSRLFRRPKLSTISCTIAGSTVAAGYMPQHFNILSAGDDTGAHLVQASSDNWSLCVEFTSPDTVVVTVRESASISSPAGVCMDIKGSLVLRQEAPDASLTLIGAAGGIHTTGKLTILIDHISITATAGPAILAGGDVYAAGLRTISLSGTEPLCSDGDISMATKPTEDSSFVVLGGVRSNGRVQFGCLPISASTP